MFESLSDTRWIAFSAKDKETVDPPSPNEDMAKVTASRRFEAVSPGNGVDSNEDSISLRLWCYANGGAV